MLICGRMPLVKSTSRRASRLRFDPSAGTTNGRASTGMVAVGWTRETSGHNGGAACCVQDGVSQARSGREDSAGDGGLSRVIGAGEDFRRFVAVVSEAAGDWRSVGVGLLTVGFERETGGGLVVVDRSRSFRRACWRCSRKEIMPPMVIGTRSASLAVDKWIMGHEKRVATGPDGTCCLPAAWT